MDHLEIPESCQPNALEVPYLGLAPKYDRLGFDGFPERHGLDSNKLISSSHEIQESPEWIESFIQEWLWFGVMDEFAKAYNIYLDLNDFITNKPSGVGQRITTASLYTVYARRMIVEELKFYALGWGLEEYDLVNLPHRPSQEVSAQIRELRDFKMKGSLSMIKSRISRMNTMGDQDDSREELSLGVLCERIFSCRVIAFDEPNSCLPRRTDGTIKISNCMTHAAKALRLIMAQRDPVTRFEVALPIAILLYSLNKIIYIVVEQGPDLSLPFFWENFESNMFARNWCPSRIWSTQYPGNIPLSYIKSLLPSYQTIPHDSCNRRKCLVQLSSVEMMTSKHRENCVGDCPPVVIDELKLISIWNKGEIPGFHQIKSGEPAEFKISNCIAQPFVAISHVWSHGLGNPFKNELPSCQIFFLSSLVKQLAGNNALLWIDTLSVPIEPESKRIAISRLRTVYSKATKVLVIDKDLMRVGKDKREQILQTLSSEWQRRLWTLQESRLARDLYIQFRDSAVPVSELIAKKPLSEKASNVDIFEPFEDLMLHYQNNHFQTEDIQSRFLVLANDFAFRSVTIKSDEPICLATLLGLKLEDFHPYPTMVEIYRSLPIVPLDLMFLVLPRLQVPGLTWAPSSFLQSSHRLFQRSRLWHSRLSVEGLHFDRDCLLFDKDFEFFRNPNISPEIYIIESSNGQKFAIQSLEVIMPDGISVRSESSRLISKPAIIWHIENADNYSRAALVSRSHEKDGVTHCRFEMVLYGWKIGGKNADFHQEKVSESGGVLETVTAKYIAKMSLCVG